MKMVYDGEIKNWKLVNIMTQQMVSKSEIGKQTTVMSGDVYVSKKFEDGDSIHTSTVTSMHQIGNTGIITTLNSTYALGEMCDEYNKFLHEQYEKFMEEGFKR